MCTYISSRVWNIIMEVSYLLCYNKIIITIIYSAYDIYIKHVIDLKIFK